ncbi:unnamed protein product, partial [Oikopleura dioica]
GKAKRDLQRQRRQNEFPAGCYKAPGDTAPRIH